MRIRVGIGGWTFAPWRGIFYPDSLPHARELAFASRAVTSIEVNGTFYRTQTAKTFATWAAQVPDGFVFSLKAVRYATNRRVLAEAGDSITAFMTSGLVELGDKLGPINWQFAPTKAFDADDFGAFLALLPARVDGVPIRHAVEVRHPSFCCAEFVALARKHNVAIVLADSPDYPTLADTTADFVYARLQDAKTDIETGYDAPALDTWATRAEAWARGETPPDLPTFGTEAAPVKPRDVFLFMINGAKERAPAAAQALMARVSA